MDSSLKGRPLQLIKVSEKPSVEGCVSYELDEDAFQMLLDTNPVAIREMPVCIVTIAGAFRRGKSFMLDFFIRYLEWQEARLDFHDDVTTNKIDTDEDWLGPDKHAHLNGFSWRGGSERETTGILVWSKIFTVKSNQTDSELAVIVMDTQGAFDSSSTIKDCATIFALSAMLSSVLIYNLTANIQEDDLNHLELFTDYGRLALEDCGETPFQVLHFLVRDWSYPYDMPYGADGGLQLVDKRLEIKDNQHESLQQLRRHIRSCFTSIKGHLMPHPGLKVATDPQFRGELADIDPTFVDQLRSFVPRLMSPDNILAKQIGGTPLKLRDVLPCLKAYMSIFGGDSMPEPKSMLQATSEANNLAALSDARASFVAQMDRVAGHSAGFLGKADMTAVLASAQSAALDLFVNRPKMGGPKVADKYQSDLESDLDELKQNYLAQNENKRVLRSAGTPVTLAVIAMSLYFMSTVFYIVNLESASLVAGWLYTLTLGLIGVWFYTKASGNWHQVTDHVDEAAATLWDTWIQPVVQLASHRASGYLVNHAISSAKH